MGWVGNLRRVANPPPKLLNGAVKRRLPTGAQDTILPLRCLSLGAVSGTGSAYHFRVITTQHNCGT